MQDVEEDHQILAEDEMNISLSSSCPNGMICRTVFLTLVYYNAEKQCICCYHVLKILALFQLILPCNLLICKSQFLQGTALSYVSSPSICDELMV